MPVPYTLTSFIALHTCSYPLDSHLPVCPQLFLLTSLPFFISPHILYLSSLSTPSYTHLLTSPHTSCHPLPSLHTFPRLLSSRQLMSADLPTLHIAPHPPLIMPSSHALPTALGSLHTSPLLLTPPCTSRLSKPPYMSSCLLLLAPPS